MADGSAPGGTRRRSICEDWPRLMQNRFYDTGRQRKAHDHHYLAWTPDSVILHLELMLREDLPGSRCALAMQRVLYRRGDLAKLLVFISLSYESTVLPYLRLVEPVHGSKL